MNSSELSSAYSLCFGLDTSCVDNCLINCVELFDHYDSHLVLAPVDFVEEHPVKKEKKKKKCF